MNYRAALAWLYATQTFGIKLGLEQTERLLTELGLSDLLATAGASTREPWRLLHVAGTNGKGSVCAMADSMLRAAGYRCGLFTSPHLVSFRERIRIDGEMIAESDVARQLTRIRGRVEQWESIPTFFEIVIALALAHFRQRQCEIVVLETGMGGRLDATNAVRSDVAVITPIDLDHQKWLGQTIAEIAREKAGIIKPGRSVLSAGQPAEAATVIRERACDLAAPLSVVNDTWTESPVALRGAHQRRNAAVAVAAVRALITNISSEAIARGLASVKWPARFQIFSERIVIDGGHNPAGAAVLAAAWRDCFGDERATIVLAVLADKDAAGILALLAPLAARFILPQIRSVRAHSPADVAAAIPPAIAFNYAENTAAAIREAQGFAEKILVTGSLHFAGEALALLEGQPAAYEECTQ